MTVDALNGFVQQVKVIEVENCITILIFCHDPGDKILIYLGTFQMLRYRVGGYENVQFILIMYRVYQAASIHNKRYFMYHKVPFLI